MNRFLMWLVCASYSVVVGCSGSDGGQMAADAASGSGTDGGASGDAAPGSGDAVPSTATALNNYLQTKSYDGFAAETAIHPTAGPHMSMVRTFFNSILATSIRAGAASHPQGSAVVKELYNGGGTLSGWAVMVKTGAGSTAMDWYFYEVLSAEPGTAPVLEGNGVGGCAGCHSTGTDYIRSNYPSTG